MLFGAGDESSSAQEAGPDPANQGAESAVGKEREQCVELWSDHKFDRLRDSPAARWRGS